MLVQRLPFRSCSSVGYKHRSIVSNVHSLGGPSGQPIEQQPAANSSGAYINPSDAAAGANAAAITSGARAALEAAAVLSATLDDETDDAMPPTSSSSAPPPPPSRARAARRVLHAINESTKWVVSAVVMAVLVAARNEWAAWAVIGAVASSFVCKVLKRLINESRPPSARKKDPGMPSSHANSLNFLSVYAALSLRQHASGTSGWAELSAATVAAGLFLTWLRVALGYHTWPQVIVGGVLGAASAAAWFQWGTAGGAVAAAVGAPGGRAALCGATLLGIAAFAARNVLQWVDERAARRGVARAAAA